MHLSSTNINNFIIKIHSIILKARVSNCDLHSLSHHQFDLSSLPIHVDILNAKQVLLERWVISFESNKRPRQSSPINVKDSSELILLLQSLYSYIRLMPLHTCLTEGSITKESLRFGLSTESSYCLSSILIDNPDSLGFDLNAKLKAYKFQTAQTEGNGNLHLSVVYDANISNQPLLPIDQNQDESIEYIPHTTDTKPSSGMGSPYPSPLTQKKVLKYSEIRHSFSRSMLRQSFTTGEDSSGSSSPALSPSLSPSSTPVSIPSDMTLGLNILNLNPNGGLELFGSLVGSYEESILSGRMSTLPSKPLTFTASLGVSGKSKSKVCCPPHIQMNFPAYFYELENDKNLATPYVGNIELPDNGYKIPPKGQVQIMIKNQSRTPIKLFLIPYDLTDMPWNTKTFLRQKSYVSFQQSSSNLFASLSNNNPSNERLRYAIHVQILCNSKGKLYIHKGMRVVFSHRTPEKDEHLRVICEGPMNPKYMPLDSNPVIQKSMNKKSSRRNSLSVMAVSESAQKGSLLPPLPRTNTNQGDSFQTR